VVTGPILRARSRAIASTRRIRPSALRTLPLRYRTVEPA
jgi:hypothetical protein